MHVYVVVVGCFWSVTSVSPRRVLLSGRGAVVRAGASPAVSACPSGTSPVPSAAVVLSACSTAL